MSLLDIQPLNRVASDARYTKKIDLVVNVKDYGAQGDGVANDTAALSTAFAAVAGGGKIILPSGRYKITGLSLSGLNNVTIEGHGAWLDCTADANPIFYFNNCNTITIEGLKIGHFTHAARNNSGYGIFALNVADMSISKCLVTTSCAAGIYVEACQRVTVSHNTVNGTLADGIHVTGGSRHVTVIGNRVTNTGDDGIASVGYQSNANDNEHINFTGNTVSYAKARGIAILGTSKAVVASNTVADTRAAGIIVAQEASYNTRNVEAIDIIGNVVQNANTYASPAITHAGIHVVAEQSGYSIDAVTIANNIIRNSAWRMISVASASVSVVSNIVVRGNSCIGNSAASGIEFNRVTNGDVCNNYVNMAFASGIYVDSTSSSINTSFNRIRFPNQGNTTGIYGIYSGAPGSRTSFNVIDSDNTKAGLTNDAAAVDAGGYVAANTSLSMNQLVAFASSRSILLGGNQGNVVARNDGGIVWVSGTNPGDDTVDAGLARDSAGIVKVTNGATGTGSLKITGGLFTGLSTKTSSYTITATDSTILANGSGITITLPSAVTAGSGRLYTVKNIGASSVTVASAAGTIDGAGTAALASQYSVGRYQSDGANWWAV